MVVLTNKNQYEHVLTNINYEQDAILLLIPVFLYSKLFKINSTDEATLKPFSIQYQFSMGNVQA